MGNSTTVSLQYARLFQLRACIQLLSEEGEMHKDSLSTALRKRKDLNADIEQDEGAEDIIEQLRDAGLITQSDNGYRLTSEEDLSSNQDVILTYSGETVSGAGSQRVQSDRILANIMHHHPMLLIISKFVYRNGPVKKFEITREFDGQAFLGDKMNQFTIQMGTDLLEDADVIDSTDNGYIQNRWPVRMFAYVVNEEYQDMVGDSGSVSEDRIFERIEMLYGISRSTFDSHLDKLHSAGIVSEGSYGELILNEDMLQGARIHE